jgi:hypothetical protein
MKRKREPMKDGLKQDPGRPYNAVRGLLDTANGIAQERADLRAALGALHSAVAELLASDPGAIPPAILERLTAARAQAEAALLATDGEG